MNRPSRISDGANARAVYNYIGPARLKQKTLLNGASTVSTYKLLYNGVGQITSALYRNAADTATIIGYEHGYDKVGNPEYEIRTHQSSEGDAYMYDNLYRVTRTIYDDADPTSPTYASARTDDWLLDDIGNRTRIYAKSASATEYMHNAVNEYTSVGGTGYEYDSAGNLTKDDTHYYYWDYENRLTKVELVDGGADVAAYIYDANNRRVEKLDYTADPDETTQYFYNGWSCIEEREDDGTLLATYINGPRIDEYILMNRDSTDYWYMQSPIVGNVAALVNSSGTIQEGYKYRAYGEATVLTGSGNDTTWFTSDDDTATVSALGNPYTFTGRRLDGETMLLYFRNRMYQPLSGSFISRDPTGYVDGMSLYLGYFAPAEIDTLGLQGESLGKITAVLYGATKNRGAYENWAAHLARPEYQKAFTSGADVMNALIEFSECACIEKLYVLSEGWGWRPREEWWHPVPGGGFYDWGAADSSGFYSEIPHDTEGNNLAHENARDLHDLEQAISDKEVRFCDDCSITMTGCRNAATQFPSGLLQVTGCDVIAATGAADGTNAPTITSGPGTWAEREARGSRLPWVRYTGSYEEFFGENTFTIVSDTSIEDLGTSLVLW